MFPALLFPVLLALFCPIYVVLHAVLLIVPLYLLLLVIGIGLLWLLIRSSEGLLLEEVFSLSLILIAVVCSIAGLALAPLPIQLFAAIALLLLGRRYPLSTESD